MGEAMLVIWQANTGYHQNMVIKEHKSSGW